MQIFSPVFLAGMQAGRLLFYEKNRASLSPRLSLVQPLHVGDDTWTPLPRRQTTRRTAMGRP